MSSAQSLALFPSQTVQLSSIDIEKITNKALKAVETRQQAAAQLRALSKSVEPQRPMQRPSLACKTSISPVKSTQVLVSPMDDDYQPSPVPDGWTRSRLAVQRPLSPPRSRSTPPKPHFNSSTSRWAKVGERIVSHTSSNYSDPVSSLSPPESTIQSPEPDLLSAHSSTGSVSSGTWPLYKRLDLAPQRQTFSKSAQDLSLPPRGASPTPLVIKKKTSRSEFDRQALSSQSKNMTHEEPRKTVLSERSRPLERSVIPQARTATESPQKRRDPTVLQRNRSLEYIRTTVTPVTSVACLPGRSEQVSINSVRKQINSAVPEKLATLEEIETLWQMANGQKVDGLTNSLCLKVSYRSAEPIQERTSRRQRHHNDDPIFTIGTSKELPFFSIYASTDDPLNKSFVEVRRHNPKVKASNISVAEFSLNKARLAPPVLLPQQASNSTDEVTTSFTPKLATLLALENVKQIREQISSPDSTPYECAVTASRLASEALQEAEEKHSATIVFEPAANGYFICHPTFGIVPVQVTGHISLGSTNMATDSQQALEPQILNHGTVTLWTPYSTCSSTKSTSANSLTKGPRKPLASLSLTASTLTLHPATLDSLSSLFTIDTVVASLIAITLTESRRNALHPRFSRALPAPPMIDSETQSSLAASSPADLRSSTPTPRLLTPPPTPPRRTDISPRPSLSSMPSTPEKPQVKGKWSIEIRGADGSVVLDRWTDDVQSVTREFARAVQRADGRAGGMPAQTGHGGRRLWRWGSNAGRVNLGKS